jgi:lysozyme
MNLTPRSRPQATRAQVLEWVNSRGVAGGELLNTDNVVLVGRRAYYKDTVGKPGQNDIGVYDDALFWLWPEKGFAAFNANTDPSRYGHNPGVGKLYARLKPGFYRFRKWRHKGQYAAFGQASSIVTVQRMNADGTVHHEEDGDNFGINIHRGGESGTSSWGCQTLPPEQWLEFQQLGYRLLDQYGQKSFPYILTDNS